MMAAFFPVNRLFSPKTYLSESLSQIQINNVAHKSLVAVPLEWSHCFIRYCKSHKKTKLQPQIWQSSRNIIVCRLSLNMQSLSPCSYFSQIKSYLKRSHAQNAFRVLGRLWKSSSQYGWHSVFLDQYSIPTEKNLTERCLGRATFLLREIF